MARGGVNVLFRLVQVFLFLLITVFGAGSAWAMSDGWSEIHYPVAVSYDDSRPREFAFAARAPPQRLNRVSESSPAISNPAAVGWFVHASGTANQSINSGHLIRFTGRYVALTGTELATMGYADVPTGTEVCVASLRFSADFVAPNRTDWTPPSNSQRPAVDKGSFVGQEGNSAFQLSDAASDQMGLPRGSVVQWKRGVPDFDDFAVAGPQGHPKSFEVTGMTGSPTGDRRLMIDSIASTTGMSKRSVERWLRSNDVRLHHAGGNRVQIVPEPVHRLHHSGGAAELRNGN
ncbi:hypothetical protein RKLH11_4206 [Rhodobacteraceae bacterium KLH11]|nr:hypothetical protein RKLH11_4206 [Rhodobacteraceae bacterium KLH11]